MNFKERLEKLKQQLEAPLLVVSQSNLFYLSGFRGSLGFLLVFPERQPFFFCDGRYTLQSREELSIEAEIVEVDQDVVGSICKVFFDVCGDRLLVEDAASVGFVRRFEEKKCSIVPCPSPVNVLRIVKDEEEIALLKKAIAVTEEAFRDTFPLIVQGAKERDIAIELEYSMRRLGGEDVAFPTIVAAGERSALPHARPGYHEARKGEWVLIDWGAKVEGYCADLTRVVPVQEIRAPQFREFLGILREAQNIAQEHIREGVRAQEVDFAAREFLKKRGLAKYFTHGLGHGVGIDVHEEPKLGSQGETILQRGMVVTVEPGVYLPGWGGLRLEHMVLVEEKGCKILDSLPETF